MAYRLSTKIISASCRALALAGLFSSLPLSLAQTKHTITPIRKREALVKRQPNEIVDTYLNQILCSNKTFKLETQNRALSLAGQLSDDEINKAFSSEIFYSLKPGEEALGSDHIKKTYSNAASILDNLRVLAVFFGHDIHDFYRDENNARTKRGEEPLSKEEFIDRFDSGEIVLKADGINLNDFIKERLAQVEKLSDEVKYGCDGKDNFLHRKGSELSRTVNESAFLIPATTSAIQMAANIKPDGDTAERKPASTGSYPQRPLTDAENVTGRTGSGRFAKYNDFVRKGVPVAALNETMAKYYYFKRQGEVTNEKHVVVVDYTQTSEKPRFWVLNLETGNATGMKVGHGDGKGLLDRQMMPKRQTAFVSSDDKSNASTWGAMLIGGAKIKDVNSKFNNATLIRGLEKHNANAYARDIIAHEAINSDGVVYVNDVPGVEAGRSNGCFALSPTNASWVQRNLPPGTFLYAFKGDIPDVRGERQAKQAMSRFR